MADIAVNLATKAGEKLVERLVDTVYSSISGELSLLIGVREEVRYITDELQIMSAFLREAEEKQASNMMVRAWVQQVRQLSYDMEDCIDEFSLHLEQHRSKNLKARRRIAVEIKSIKSRVQEVSNRRLRYGIIDMNRASSSEDHNVVQYDPRLAALFIEDAQLVGIDAPREKLVGWLMDETECELRLIAVVGGGGLGKTTIVRKAYENPTVNCGHFTCRAWITVSQVYHVEGLLREMIKQFMNPSPPEDLDKFGRQQLITELLNYLKDKRYIIVFDDIWTIDAWKSLEMVLPNKDLVGSRVMLTTRNKEVAEACLSDIPGHFYPHEKLTEQQSMDLFCRRTFNNLVCPEEFKKDSENLLKKCDGLPLAIVSIAGVLASRPKKTIQEWENLLGRLGSELEGNPNLEGVKKILTLSYNDLPYSVKRCFLYLCKFPEDYVMYRKDVQRLWIVEGFVVGRRDMTAEEVAESYFNDLVNRFMILPTTFSNVSGKVKSFKVHDIMLELILSKSLDEKFVIIIGKSSECMPHDVIRRMSTHLGHNPKNMCLSHVRSLSMFGDGITTISPSMRMLRVLDMDGNDRYAKVGDHFFEILDQWLHLKYLRLREIGGLRLPKSLGNCRNLEILDLRGNGNAIKIPSGVTKLQQLRILRGDCLILPRGMGSLRTLQELAGVYMGESEKHVVREIGKLTQLRKLGIDGLTEERGNDFCKSLERLSSSLRSLKVGYSYGQDRAALYNLSSPPLLLESLQLAGYTDKENKLPPWVGQLNQAVRVTLGDFHLDDSDIRVVGSLPNLMKLHLSFNNKYDGGRLSFGAGGFPCLKTLHLGIINENLKRLSFEEGTMPHLESITLDDYQEKTVEGPVGLKNLPSLKEFNLIYYGSQDSSLWDALSAETAEHPNHPRLVRGRVNHTWCRVGQKFNFYFRHCDGR